METNDLMKSLERMKSVLTDIQSAKQQVESTVNAYNTLSEKVSGLVDSIDNLSDSLSGIVNNIQKDYQGKLKQMTAESDKIVTSSNNTISKLDTSIATFNEVISQKMKEQEQYFIDTAKWQKRVIYLLFVNIVVVSILLLKVFIG